MSSIYSAYCQSYEINFFFIIFRTNISRRRIFIALCVAIIIIVGAVSIYSFGVKNGDAKQTKLLRGAVAANGKECAAMGAEILKLNGSVADAAIVTMLCEGITCKLKTEFFRMSNNLFVIIF